MLKNEKSKDRSAFVFNERTINKERGVCVCHHLAPPKTMALHEVAEFDSALHVLSLTTPTRVLKKYHTYDMYAFILC